MKSIRIVLLFGIAGVIGFLVDTAVLYLLKDRFGLYLARALSFVCAAFATWVVNRNLTFRGRHSGLSARTEFTRYLVLMLGGGFVNYGVYVALVSQSLFVMEHPVIGVAAGSLAGMAINLVSSRWLIYRFASKGVIE